MKDPLRPMSKEFVRGRVETNHRATIEEDYIRCACGWFSDEGSIDVAQDKHQAHQEDMVQRLLTAPY